MQLDIQATGNVTQSYFSAFISQYFFRYLNYFLMYLGFSQCLHILPPFILHTLFLQFGYLPQVSSFDISASSTLFTSFMKHFLILLSLSFLFLLTFPSAYFQVFCSSYSIQTFITSALDYKLLGKVPFTYSLCLS